MDFDIINNSLCIVRILVTSQIKTHIVLTFSKKINLITTYRNNQCLSVIILWICFPRHIILLISEFINVFILYRNNFFIELCITFFRLAEMFSCLYNYPLFLYRVLVLRLYCFYNWTISNFDKNRKLTISCR